MKTIKTIKTLIFMIIALVGISVSALANSPPVQKENPAVICANPTVTMRSQDQNVLIQGFNLNYGESPKIFALEFSEQHKPPVKNLFGQPPELVKLE